MMVTDEFGNFPVMQHLVDQNCRPYIFRYLVPLNVRYKGKPNTYMTRYRNL